MDVAGAGRRWSGGVVGIGVNKAFNAEAGPLIAVVWASLLALAAESFVMYWPANPHDFTYRNLRNCLYYRRYCHATAYYTFSVPLETASMMGMS